MGETVYEAVCVGQFCCIDAFLICSVQLSVSDIVHDSTCKEVGVLEHDAQGAAEGRFLNFIDIDSVISDFSVLYVIEAVNQVGDGGLARPGRAYKCNFLTGLGKQLDVMEYHLGWVIAEIHSVKNNAAFHFLIGNSPLCLMGVFPGPDTGALFCLFQCAVLPFPDIHKFHIPIVLLRLLVQKLKYPSGACRCHDHRVHLLAGLGNRLGEIFIESHEGNDGADCNSTYAV